MASLKRVWRLLHPTYPLDNIISSRAVARRGLAAHAILSAGTIHRDQTERSDVRPPYGACSVLVPFKGEFKLESPGRSIGTTTIRALISRALIDLVEAEEHVSISPKILRCFSRQASPQPCYDWLCGRRICVLGKLRVLTYLKKLTSTSTATGLFYNH